MNNGLIPLRMENRSMEVKDFSYDEKKVRVIIDEEGNPWWVAADACSVLNIKNVSDAIVEIDSEDKRSIGETDIPNINKNMKLVNEPGLYQLIFKSKKPEAKSFKRWITHEVLPEIRKTGGYNAGGQLVNQEAIQVLSASIEKGLSHVAKEICGELKDIRHSVEEAMGEGFSDIAGRMPMFDESEKAIKRLCGHVEDVLRDKDLII